MRPWVGKLRQKTIHKTLLHLILLGMAFVLYPLNALEKDVGVSLGGNSAVPSMSFAYNVSSEQEVDQIIIHAQKVGAKIVKEPQKVFWGGYSGYFSDPDGYLWEVAHNPFVKTR